MTDKQQIELQEIANIIVKTDWEYRGICWQDGVVKCPYGEPMNCQACLTAKNIIDANYRKVDENHIVIPLDGSKMVIPRKDKQKLLHEMYEQGKFDAIAEIAEGEKIMLSSTQVQILRHSLGMDNKPIMNNRYHAYRNYFETSFDAPNKSCDLLKHWGLMEAKPHQRGITFRVTEKGIEVLQEFLGIEIIIK